MYCSISESFIYQADTLLKQERKKKKTSVLKHSLFDTANQHSGSELGLEIRSALGSGSVSSLDRILCFCIIISRMAGGKECWSPQLCCLSLHWGTIGWKIKTLQKVLVRDNSLTDHWILCNKILASCCTSYFLLPYWTRPVRGGRGGGYYHSPPTRQNSKDRVWWKRKESFI